MNSPEGVSEAWLNKAKGAAAVIAAVGATVFIGDTLESSPEPQPLPTQLLCGSLEKVFTLGVREDGAARVVNIGRCAMVTYPLEDKVIWRSTQFTITCFEGGRPSTAQVEVNGREGVVETFLLAHIPGVPLCAPPSPGSSMPLPTR